MANEANQNGDNVEQTGMPTRVLRIDGERTGRLFTNAIRVGRIDKRLRDLSLSTNADQRRQFRLGDEGFSKAIGDFENALDQIEKDLAFTSRSNKTAPQGNRQQGQGSQKAQRPAPKEKPAPQRVVAGVVQPKAQTESPAAAAAPAATLAPSDNQQPQQPQAQAKKPRKRKKRKTANANTTQAQVPAAADQKPAVAKQPGDKGGAEQQAPTKANAGGKTGQQQKPAADKQPAATPALS